MEAPDWSARPRHLAKLESRVFDLLAVGFGVMLPEVESLYRVDRNSDLVLDSVGAGRLRGTTIELFPLLATK